jgi:hypothetical protein
LLAVCEVVLVVSGEDAHTEEFAVGWSVMPLFEEDGKKPAKKYSPVYGGSARVLLLHGAPHQEVIGSALVASRQSGPSAVNQALLAHGVHSTAGESEAEVKAALANESTLVYSFGRCQELDDAGHLLAADTWYGVHDIIPVSQYIISQLVRDCSRCLSMPT